MLQLPARAFGTNNVNNCSYYSSGERCRSGSEPWIDVRPGNAVMYYPAANTLVPRDVDPRSKTPAFKSVLVEIVFE